MYEFVRTQKSAITRSGIRQSLASARPEMRVEAIKDDGDYWLVRLVKRDDRVSASQRVAELPPFLKKDDEAPAEEAPKDEAPEGEEHEDKPKEEGEEKSDEKGDKDDGEGDALGKLKNLVSEIQGLFDELVNSSGEVAQKAEEKDQKIKDIHDTVAEEVGDAAGLADIGPTPGSGPPMPGAPAPKAPAAPGAKPPRKRPAPPGVSTFTHRRSFIATHEGVDADGNRISMVAAAAQLEADPQFEDYHVVNIKEEGDKYVAKLELKSE